MWFTDSDKVLWTLVVCTFINILGLAFMEGIYINILVGAASSIATLFGTHFSESRKEKDRLRNIKKIIIDISENVHLVIIKEIEKDYQTLLEMVNSDSAITSVPMTSTLPIVKSLTDYFDKKDLIKIILKLKKVQYSELYRMDQDIKLIIEESPFKIHKNLNDLILNNQKNCKEEVEKNPHLAKMTVITENIKQEKIISNASYSINSRLLDIQEIKKTYEKLIQELK